ncbi:MAG TPA: hypothetical protein VFE42_16850 [Chloroflexota bacterium]|nr:hypothetical protein [Chloroflexota bacterium]
MARVSNRRAGITALLLLGLTMAGAVGLWEARQSERVFTVAEVQRGLASHPRQWIGRAILVRGVLLVSMSDPGVIDVFHPPPYILVTYSLYQPGPARSGGVSGLPLALKLAPHLAAPQASPLADLLRRVPWLQQFVGRPKVPIFRITVLPPKGSCGVQACPDAQLDQQP